MWRQEQVVQRVSSGSWDDLGEGQSGERRKMRPCTVGLGPAGEGEERTHAVVGRSKTQ